MAQQIEIDTNLEERKAQIAEVIGEDASYISNVMLDMETMKSMGVLVDIDVCGTSLFTKRATWDELGIPKDDVRRKRLKRGRKDLIPQFYVGRLRSLETRFRQSLEKHSFILKGFRPYKWVPYTAYDAWKEEWDSLQAELAELKAEIIANMDTFRDDIANDWAAIARESWEAIEARRSPNAGGFVLMTTEGVFETVDEFVDHVVERATAQLPTVEDIRGSLYVTYRNAMVITGADAEAEVLRRERLLTQREEERARQRRIWREQQAQQELLEIEEQERRELARLRIQQEQARLQAMHEAEMEHARQMVAETVSPFAEVIFQFRAQIAGDVAAIMKSIKKNGYVRGKVAERARGLLDAYRLLGAAAGDDDLENALVELQRRLGQRPTGENAPKYDTDAVMGALEDIAEVAHSEIAGLVDDANAHTRAGALEL
jgi:hypothetical protein